MFKNGFYVVAIGEGGVIFRQAYFNCSVMEGAIKRLILVGVPNTCVT